jgi:aldehyde dehydrogenase (NAD+)
MSTTFDRTRPPVYLNIGGEQIATGSGGTYDHIDPTTGQVDAQVPLAGRAEIERAVVGAHQAFETWRATAPAERRRLLTRLADAIEDNAAEFARLGVLDNGMAISTAFGLTAQAADWTRYYAGYTDKLRGDTNTYFGADGEFSYTLALPYGVIGVIITWNGPLASLAMKIPAALAAGNTVVVKPSEFTPFSGQLFADLLAEVGFPPGVVNIVPGAVEAGSALVEHPLVKKITFTGGSETARKILHSCAETMKPAILELGGKSANIIFDDADLNPACQWGARRALGTLSGQGCGFPTRMLVHDNIYDDVVDRVAAIAKEIRVGDPFDPDTDTGPLINQAAVDRVLAMIERALLEGARLVAGGGRIGGQYAQGYYIEPTVFADVDPMSELGQKEVFGPVLAIMKFMTEQDAVRIANATPYGLASYIQTNDLRRAHRVAEQLDGCTMINGAQHTKVSRPFGGSGLSGYGREGGRQGIEEFLQIKSIGING